MKCTVCGGESFDRQAVLWPALCREWALRPEEVNYVNDQQGMTCRCCHCNLRALALALAIMSSLGYKGIFEDFVKNRSVRKLKVLEVNSAGPLTAWLSGLPGRRFVEYPEIDMMQMSLPSNHYDLVVHSDTLEHIPDPIRGLKECLRVLKPGGSCVFTVPVIIGRMSRSREGLPASYHGAEHDSRPDFLVHYEFGCDVWTFPLQAGFSSVSLQSVMYPAAIAIRAVK